MITITKISSSTSTNHYYKFQYIPDAIHIYNTSKKNTPQIISQISIYPSYIRTSDDHPTKYL